jgi:predicted phage terminase large subunit-like protein
MEDPQGLLTELCRQDFTAFLHKAWPWISGGDALVWNWHLDAIAYRLEMVELGEIRRALMNLPPRNGKSKTVSVIWVAWMLGRDPTLNFVCVSYSNELSGKMARDCRAVMESAWYREIFPGTAISRTRSASHDFETTKGGGRLSTSVGGSLTGRGGDIIILDDVIKPEEANSETTRNSVNVWFQSTLASRLDDKKRGVIICVMQRLHENDLTGMLLEHSGWDHLSLPAIATQDETIMLARGGVFRRREGDVLHQEREPIAVLNELKDAMGSYAFEAQYQQQPMPADGNLFKAEWLRTSPDGVGTDGYGEIVQSWDTAIKTGSSNDYSVCITARIIRKEIHIIDIWRGKVEFPALEAKAVELAQLHSAKTMLVEDKASGQQLIQALRAGRWPGVPRPIPRMPEADKVTRAAGISSIVEAGQLFLPAETHWLAEFQKELLAFPSSRHDDQVDALSQLLDWTRRKWAYQPIPSVGGILFTLSPDGIVYSTGDEDYGELDEGDLDRDPW